MFCCIRAIHKNLYIPGTIMNSYSNHAICPMIKYISLWSLTWRHFIVFVRQSWNMLLLVVLAQVQKKRWSKYWRAMETCYCVSRPVARSDFFGGVGPKKVDFLNLTPLNPPTKTPFLVHFVDKSGPFGRLGGASHPAPPWLRACVCPRKSRPRPQKMLCPPVNYMLWRTLVYSINQMLQPSVTTCQKNVLIWWDILKLRLQM